jgi:aconitate hydratase
MTPEEEYMGQNSFGARGFLDVDGERYGIYRLAALADRFDLARLPYSIKVLLENLLRNEDGVNVTTQAIEALADFAMTGAAEREIAFSPARILLQDLTGVPCVVDLAALRDAVADLGGRIEKVNPQIPVDLVIDHSVVVDVSGRPDALSTNTEQEFERNGERYQLLRWAQGAFANFRVVPPDTGICHQVNLELLSKVVFSDAAGNAYPDTLIGTDSHTTMVNGLGVLGWGAGGIEAEAAMLGQPVAMLIPKVVGLRLVGDLPEGSTATDLVLTIAELLRNHGVVGKFVECYGPGVANVPVENRATIGNMSPEYGSTVTVFPIDEETLRYLTLTARPPELIRLVEAYAKEQGLWNDPHAEIAYSEHLELDLATVVPSIAGPSRPQDRVRLDRSKQAFIGALRTSLPKEEGSADEATTRAHNVAPVRLKDGTEFSLDHGAVVIAAITSCTNTSNPQVMVAAGLLAKRAVELGLSAKPWVKTSLAPGSRVVMDYFDRAGLTPYLDKLGFSLVAFGCTTCIGNSGPLPGEISAAINANGLACAAVLSGNRNFEGRIHPDVRMNYLASPPLVVAYALAGTMDFDMYNEPLGNSTDGTPIYLKDLWPTSAEVARVVEGALSESMFRDDYDDVFVGDERWQSLNTPLGQRYAWNKDSTYVAKPPYFDSMGKDPAPITDIVGARVLAILGDMVTTDHISPAGSIRASSPAGSWLIAHGVAPDDFNSYGTRRGNHNIMARATFANSRVRNRLVKDTEGGVSMHFPDGTEGSIFEVSARYQAEHVPLVVLAGREYGAGSSRDWAAKGPMLLGVRAVIAQSFERIHRSNLIGMGIAPLQFLEGDDVATLGLTGREVYSITGLKNGDLLGASVRVQADDKTFEAILRIDTRTEAEYYRHGGILPYVARALARS